MVPLVLSPCIVIELTPECDQGLWDQPSTVLYMPESAVRVQLYIYSGVDVMMFN